jgi:hypothetical protein
MTVPFGELIDSLLRDLQNVPLPGHPDGPRVVSMSIEEAVDLIRNLASQHSRIDHFVITDPGNAMGSEIMHEVLTVQPEL